MRYQGEKIEIPLGLGGLLTDENPNEIPPNFLLEAKNVLVRNRILQKDFGSRRWNLNPHDSGIVAMREWRPTEAQSYLIVITRNGEIFRYSNRENRIQLTPQLPTDPTALTITKNRVFITEAGQEIPGQDKKLFIFTGNNQVQVISAEETTYTSVAEPAADWTTGQFPTFGVMHRDRLWAVLEHRVYASNPNNHEQFITSAIQFPVYPGQGSGIASAFVFRGKLFFFKSRGGGIAQLIDDDISTANWYLYRVNAEFDSPAHEAIAEMAGDVLAWNGDGSITSMSAVDTFGNVDAADVLKLRKVKDYLFQLASDELDNRRAIYDSRAKMGYFVLQPADRSQNNMIWKIDFSTDSPQITVSDKEQPNCMALIKMATGREKPFYGAEDGYLYEMEVEDREVGKVFNPISPVAALGSGAGALDNATYRFAVSFADGSGNESLLSSPSTSVTVTDNATDGKVELSGISVDSTGTATKRIVYGKKSTDSSFTKVAEIADNTTTTYTVNSDPATWTAVTLPTKNTFNEAYEMRVLSPPLDLSHANPALGNVQKHFDHIEIGFKPQGRWDVALEYWIDGIYRRSRNFSVSKGAILDDFTLDTDRLDSGASRYVSFKLHGAGRQFQFALTESGLMQNVEITSVAVYFRISNEDQKAVLSGRKRS